MPKYTVRGNAIYTETIERMFAKEMAVEVDAINEDKAEEIGKEDILELARAEMDITRENGWTELYPDSVEGVITSVENLEVESDA